MKIMDEYFIEIKRSMKGATPSEAVAQLIQLANEEWATQCQKTWNPELTQEVLTFIKTAENKYGVKGFRITAPNVAHECMRDDLKCINWIGANILTPEYIETLMERDKYMMSRVFARAENDTELLETLLTPEYVAEQMDKDACLYEKLPDCYKNDSQFIKQYLATGRVTGLSARQIEAHPELVNELLKTRFGCTRLINTMPPTSDIVHAALERYPDIYSDAPKAVKRNEDCALIAVSKAVNFRSIPIEFKGKQSFVREAVKRNRDFFCCAPKKIRYDREFCISLIKDDITMIQVMADDAFSAESLYGMYQEIPQLAYTMDDKRSRILLEYAQKRGDDKLSLILETRLKSIAERKDRREKEMGEVNAKNGRMSDTAHNKLKELNTLENEEIQVENEYLQSVTGIAFEQTQQESTLTEDEYEYEYDDMDR